MVLYYLLTIVALKRFKESITLESRVYCHILAYTAFLHIKPVNVTLPPVGSEFLDSSGILVWLKLTVLFSLA